MKGSRTETYERKEPTSIYRRHRGEAAAAAPAAKRRSGSRAEGHRHSGGAQFRKAERRHLEEHEDPDAELHDGEMAQHKPHQRREEAANPIMSFY